jgi:hypothetical protein
MKLGCIYKLIDPRSGCVRYIGQTIMTLKKRASKHVADCKTHSTHVNQWLKGLKYAGLGPVIEEVEKCEISCLDDRERHYIVLYRINGHDLTNLDGGGRTNRNMSEETRNKISKSLTGKVQSAETREKRRISSTEAWKDETLRAEKRRLAKIQREAGTFNMTGRPSNRKGKPFIGDRSKLSASLKAYYAQNRIKNEARSIGL